MFDPSDPRFFDADAVEKELARVAEICDGCRRCHRLCPSFDHMLDRIDANEGGLCKLNTADNRRIVDLCWQCKLAMKIRLTDIRNLVEYEKVRESERARTIALKRARRIGIGENLTLLFENRQTVLFQIHEMMRTERIVDEGRIQDEIDAYAPLLPGPSELSATLFIEIPELPRMSQERVREAVNRFQGLDRDAILLEIGPYRIPARFESGRRKEEKMTAVHYVRFPVSPEAREALERSGERVRLVADHPNYRAESEVPPETRAQMLADLEPS